MNEIAFGAGHEPLIRDAAQERFWALIAAEAEAPTPFREHTAAQVDAFLQEHPDREFAVFRPEVVAAAFDPTIAPLFSIRDMPAEGLTGSERIGENR